MNLKVIALLSQHCNDSDKPEYNFTLTQLIQHGRVNVRTRASSFTPVSLTQIKPFDIF